jgi:hypothetical protein
MCRAQYKGRKNFWEIGMFHTKTELEQWHDFPASHHYSGPHDNAGKAPRIKMAKDVAFEKQSIYDYHCCYEYCKKHLAAPSEKSEDVQGTWGCNGTHHWLAFSNGEDAYKDKYDSVQAPRHDVSAISGSNELYSFRGASVASAEGSKCTVKQKFMQCYCTECRERRCATCPSRAEFGHWQTTVMKKLGGSGHRRTRGAVRDEACQNCGSTDDGGGDPTR